jgi:hypothetical protein
VAAKRTYVRDANGRFASTGGGGPRRPAVKAAPTRAGNRLNRDNAGKITGIGRDGALARGGRIRTASGNRRATQTAKIKGAVGAVIGKPRNMMPGAMAAKRFGDYAFRRIENAKRNLRNAQSRERRAWAKEKPALIASMSTPSSGGRRGQPKGNAPLYKQASISPDGARPRGATTRSRSAVSTVVAEVKAAGIPIQKPRSRQNPSGVPGAKVRKGWQPGTVNVMFHSEPAYRKGLDRLTQQGFSVSYNNPAGWALTINHGR